MLLKKLIVRKTMPQTIVIREIDFNLNGLNLIVDDTKKVANESGNSVGKTTVIRIIDLCLGGNTISAIYKDKDTDTENNEIKKLLNAHKVEAELIVLDGDDEYSITRELFIRGKKSINGTSYNKDDFNAKLKEIFFDSIEEKPTFRQLIPRFIRLEETQLDNVINYLKMTTKESYEAIYLFLLSIEEKSLLSKKNILEEELRMHKTKLDYYRKDNNIPSIDHLEQSLKLVNKDLEAWTKKRKELDYLDTYKTELNKRYEISQQLDEINQEIEFVMFDKSLIEKSIKKIMSEKNDIDISRIKTLYSEAQKYNDKLDKTFQDVLRFHNSMIENRIKFIKPQLNLKIEKLEKLKVSRDELLLKKQKISIDLVDEGLLNELELLNREIDELNIQKGEFLNSIDILNNALEDITNLEKQIDDLRKLMDSENQDIGIGKFNEFFSKYSEKLYGEKYVFVYNKDWRNIKNGKPFTIGNLNGNIGTGKKRGLIIAFDLAYLSYVDELNLKSPKFIIHDKLENTHINQLDTIFKLSKDIKGQYIVPILRERVSSIDQSLIEEAKIIELSENDKFFRI